MRSDQRFDFTAQSVVSGTGLRDEQAALLRAIADRRVEDFLNLLPAFGCHRFGVLIKRREERCRTPSVECFGRSKVYSNWRRNHARAIFQSRSTVAWLIPRTSAV